jgi:hypothetical protein
VRAGGVTFDPRTDVFQPPSMVIDTPAGQQTIQPTITTQQSEIARETFWQRYEFMLLREANNARNQVTPSAPRPPVNSTQQSEIDRETFWQRYEFMLLREANNARTQ